MVRATDGLFLEEAKQVAREFPDIQVDEANIDAICMWLLKNPFNYDVLVAPNLYGDIISDLCAQMVGGLGFGCSGNIGAKLAVFEPTHGSAPKYAGQYKVNPIATILAAKMMLDWLGEGEKGRRLEQATAAVIREGKVRTYDMGGAATTMQMAEAIAGKMTRRVTPTARIVLHEVGMRDGLQMESRRPSRSKPKTAVARGPRRHGRRCHPGRLVRPSDESPADGRHRQALPRTGGSHPGGRDALRRSS